jgi:hypothetical protein
VKSLFYSLKIAKSIYPFVIFLITSLAVFYWLPNALHNEYLGAGDYIFPTNVTKEFHNAFFSIYDNAPFGGIDKSERLPEILFYWPIMWIVNKLNLPTTFGTLTYIAAMIYVAQISIYFWLKHVIKTEKSQNLYLIISSVIYAYSPYLTIYIAPGQMANYMFYAFFPIILLFTDKILNSVQINHSNILILFILLSIFSGGASLGFGPLYSIIWAIGLYSFVLTLLNFNNFKTILLRFLLIIMILIFSNIYWLIAWIFDGFTQTQQFASPSITNGIYVASYFANIPNLFLGKAGGFTHLQGLPHLPITTLYVLLTIGFFTGFYYLYRNIYFLTVSGFFLLSTFITKGTNAPFSFIFLFLNNYFPGFSVFRRPVNKFSGVYLTCFITLAIWGLISFEKIFPKYKSIIRKIILFILICGGIFCIYTTLNGGALKPFSTPKYYNEAWNYLIKDHVARVVVVPGLSGVSPQFNNDSFNGYYGYDPLYKIWNTSIVIPDFTDYSPSLALKPKINDSILSIIKTGKFCEYTKKTGVSHILIRNDLSGINNELSPDEYGKYILNSTDWQDHKYFGPIKKGIDIFSVKPECRSNILTVINNGNNVPNQITKLSSVKYIISTEIKLNSFSINFLNNYSPWWVLIPNNKINHSWVSDMLLLIPRIFPNQNHNILHNWANSWNLKNNYSNNFILYYLPQSAVYLGMIIWIGILIALVVFVIINKLKLWKQK